MIQTNLLQETLEVLRIKNYSEDKILWVGSIDSKFAITWAKFKEIANQIYDSDYGDVKVATDLMIFGKNFRLYRNEDTGKEWWESPYINTQTKFPLLPKNFTSFEVIIGNRYPTLTELNNQQYIP